MRRQPFFEIYNRLLFIGPEVLVKETLDGADSESSDLINQSSVFNYKVLEFPSQVLDLRIFNSNLNMSSVSEMCGLRLLEESVSVLVNDTVSAFQFADSALELQEFLLDSSEAVRADSTDLASEGGDFRLQSRVLILNSLVFRLISSDIGFNALIIDLK